MPSKSDLPITLQMVSKFLSVGDVNSLYAASKAHALLFKPQMEASKGLLYVALSDEDQLRNLLKKNNQLVTQKGKVIDKSGRLFVDVSFLQYALWALDMKLCKTIVECVPSQIKYLRSQYNKFEKEGINYWFEGKEIKGEKHFNFNETIIKALKVLEEYFNNPKGKPWAQIVEKWTQEVGGAQKQLPAHVVKEYSSNTSFEPTPSFKKRPNTSPNVLNDWFTPALGVTVAMYKGSGLCAWPSEEPTIKILMDLKALTHLHETRMEEFKAFKTFLKTAEENHTCNSLTTPV